MIVNNCKLLRIIKYKKLYKEEKIMNIENVLKQVMYSKKEVDFYVPIVTNYEENKTKNKYVNTSLFHYHLFNKKDSFIEILLYYPVYTKPVDFRGMKVPDVLLSGHHENIRKWRCEQALKKTKERRPDLLEKS